MKNQEMHTHCGWWSKFHSNCGGCPFHCGTDKEAVSLETFKSHLEYHQKNIDEVLDKMRKL